MTVRELRALLFTYPNQDATVVLSIVDGDGVEGFEMLCSGELRLQPGASASEVELSGTND